MSRLVPCSSCRRHVKRGEAACPFCAAPLESTTAAVAEARPVPPGMKRAALFAMSVSLAASACEADNAVPVYGAPNVGGNSGFAGDANGGGQSNAGQGGGGNGGDGNGGGGAGAISGGSSGTGGTSAGASGDPTDAGDAGDATPLDGGDAGDSDAAP
ncbi:MAG TPA: hypothetical protein VMG12_01040 [Polyangiaceae bacterium]|nr:hypothetical protein [Polyangiaceae bacterium]